MATTIPTQTLAQMPGLSADSRSVAALKQQASAGKTEGRGAPTAFRS